MKRLAKWRTGRRAATLLLLTIGGAVLTHPETAIDRFPSPSYLNHEVLDYGIEWRLFRAGTVKLAWTPVTTNGTRWDVNVHLESAGVVSRLYKVDDTYTATLADQVCAEAFGLRSIEGKRSRATEVKIDRTQNKAHYIERDLTTNKLFLERTIDVPACTADVIGGLYRLRSMKLEPGQSTQIPMSDGKKAAQARIEAQEREDVKTPVGTFKTIRYEAFLFNNVLFNKNARLFLWLTDDARRLPVQVRVRLPIMIGTITLQLEKEQKL